jgi:SagB-type dehydrogenase family enzyme
LDAGTKVGEKLKLPEPRLASEVPLEKALAERHSVRAFTDELLGLEDISQLCWAAQGITRKSRGFRTAPSAGALFPLELYLLTPEAVFRYLPSEHALKVEALGDIRGDLGGAALGQGAVHNGVCTFVICGVLERTRVKYGERALQYVYIEAGHAAQNILLQAVALELGGVPVGAFRDDAVAGVLDLPKGWMPLYIIPTGHSR